MLSNNRRTEDYPCNDHPDTDQDQPCNPQFLVLSLVKMVHVVSSSSALNGEKLNCSGALILSHLTKEKFISIRIESLSGLEWAEMLEELGRYRLPCIMGEGCPLARVLGPP